MTRSLQAVLEAVEDRFPGMEHYFANGAYPCVRFDRQAEPHPNPHGEFFYCGFVDSLSCPYHGRVWRSATLRGLLRAVDAESTETPDYPQQRFKL